MVPDLGWLDLEIFQLDDGLKAIHIQQKPIFEFAFFYFFPGQRYPYDSLSFSLSPSLFPFFPPSSWLSIPLFPSLSMGGTTLPSNTISRVNNQYSTVGCIASRVWILCFYIPIMSTKHTSVSPASSKKSNAVTLEKKLQIIAQLQANVRALNMF